MSLGHAALREAGQSQTGGAAGRIDAEGATSLTVPGALLDAAFSRGGVDLVLTAPDGTSFIIAGYFDQAAAPDLRTPGGALLPGDLVERLAGPVAPGQYAANAGTLGSEPIGRVESVVGEVQASRVDGVTAPLSQGAPVYQGDVIETAAGAALTLVFIDETTLSLGEAARMILDELVFDPDTLAGASTFSIVQGVFTFVSGEIAAHNPDDMIVRTPIATIGIRGTGGGGRGAQEGEENTVMLLPEIGPDGAPVVGQMTVWTESGRVVLDEAYEATTIISVFLPPSEPGILARSDAGAMVAQLAPVMPASISNGLSETDAPRGGRPDGSNPPDAGGDDGPNAGAETEAETGAEERAAREPDAAEAERIATEGPIVASTQFDIARVAPSVAPPRTVVRDAVADAPDPPPEHEPGDHGGDDDAPPDGGGGGGPPVGVTLTGGSGDDILTGTALEDVLIGGAGDDQLVGLARNDVLRGGTGADSFQFLGPGDGVPVAADGAVTIGAGSHDVITDFDSGTDVIILDDAGYDLGGTLIQSGGGQNVFTIGSPFDGRNSGSQGGGAYLVIDVNGTLYHDDNSQDPGYTVVTETQGTAPVFTDLVLDTGGGR